MTRGAKAAAADQNETDPLLAALKRAPVGQPLTVEEQRLKREAKAVNHWIKGQDVTAEIRRRSRCESETGK
jgi:hypothetical protein